MREQKGPDTLHVQNTRGVRRLVDASRNQWYNAKAFIESRRNRMALFLEDVSDKESVRRLRRGVDSAFAAGILGGVAGTAGGVIVDLGVYSINNTGAVPQSAIIETVFIPDNPLVNLYILSPVIGAVITGVVLGGIGFYKGVKSSSDHVDLP